MDADCVFCRIVAGEIPAHKIYETNRALAFLDVTPRAKGHTMVIPTVHSPTLAELPAAEIGPLFEAVQKVAGILMAKLHPDGLTIGINQGDASGQTVKHLHVHLMPRFTGDGGGSVHTVVDRPSDDTLDEIAKTITT